MYAALDALTRAVSRQAGVADNSGWLEAVTDREAVMTTGIGGGVAIPHVRTDDLSEPSIGLGLSAAGISYETLDKHPVHIIVLFAMPKQAERKYLGLLAQVMQALRRRDFCERLKACGTRDDVLDALNDRPATSQQVQSGG